MQKPQPRQQQLSSSPSSPGPVPQICISPQNDFGVRQKSRSPDSRNHILRNYNSWNANAGQNGKCRSCSVSPCRRGGQGSYRDENGNSLRDMMQISRSQENVQNLGLIDLSSSAPERSFQQAMDRRRLYSVPQGNFLDVPQQQLLSPVCHIEEKENAKKDNLRTSCKDPFSLYVQNNPVFVKPNRNQARHSESACGQDFLVMPDMSHKNKHGVINSVKEMIRILGLSPRTSPYHSPASSRSPSPGSSPTPSTPCDSAFSPSAEWPVKPS